MAKRANAPKGFYTAAEAIEKLGMARNTFFTYVRKEKIKKVVPPGQVEGFYRKVEIDKLAEARELFTLEYATDSSTFQRATEEDMRGIYELCVHLWGANGTPSYEARLGEYRANPYTYYVIKQDEIIVGFLSLTPFKEEALKVFMGETYEHVIEGPEAIEPFIPGKPIDNLFLDIGVRRGLRKGEVYGMRLIQGGIKVLEDFARQGNIVKKLLATSSVPDGINLCKGLGFRELPTKPGSTRKHFELNLETANSPFLKTYQQLVKARLNVSGA